MPKSNHKKKDRKLTKAATKPEKIDRPAASPRSIVPLFLAGLVLLLASGVVHGLWTERWHSMAGSRIAVERLNNVPMTIGTWDAVSRELEPRIIEKAEIEGYMSREYVDRESGQVVSILLVGGRPGPIAVHTPDICFRGQGYKFTEEPMRQTFSLADRDKNAEAWTATPVRETAGLPDYLRVLWTWSFDGQWQAPDNPRITFAASPAIYKLYVTRPASSDSEPWEDDTCVAFLRLLIPELERALFQPTASSGAQLR